MFCFDKRHSKRTNVAIYFIDFHNICWLIIVLKNKIPVDLLVICSLDKKPNILSKFLAQIHQTRTHLHLIQLSLILFAVFIEKLSPEISLKPVKSPKKNIPTILFCFQWFFWRLSAALTDLHLTPGGAAFDNCRLKYFLNDNQMSLHNKFLVVVKSAISLLLGSCKVLGVPNYFPISQTMNTN